MPGLPPILFDEGEDITECPLLTNDVPFRIQLVMEGVKNIDPFRPDFNSTVTLTQSETEPSRFINRFEILNQWWEMDIVIDKSILGRTVIFMGTENGWQVCSTLDFPECQIEGIYLAQSTIENPGIGGYYDGQITVTIF